MFSFVCVPNLKTNFSAILLHKNQTQNNFNCLSAVKGNGPALSKNSGSACMQHMIDSDW